MLNQCSFDCFYCRELVSNDDLIGEFYHTLYPDEGAEEDGEESSAAQVREIPAPASALPCLFFFPSSMVLR